MSQTILVILILAVTVFFVVRRTFRLMRHKDGCNCGCNGCPHASDCDKRK
ncbi:MAG: FeoB-associated Cys-rich membrane protein [Bacteroidales bacterium]|nr:FeoB-associated Cys-rich membrane protein [Bacteroidales bacterium]